MSVAAVDCEGGARFCACADLGIKLFGRDIPLSQETSEEASIVSLSQHSSHQDDVAGFVCRTNDGKEPMDIVSCKSESSACIELRNKAMCSTSVMMGETLVKIGASIHNKLSKVEESQGPLSPEKAPKKPDKLLPCPRCHSLDTKFCYYNNYNVNQPRHFCRKCQRYWTAGGTLRNVPVGAGRRKHKHSTLHRSVSCALQVRTSAPDVGYHRFCDASTAKPRLHVIPLDAQSIPTLDSPSANSSSLLSFDQESPLCKSMVAPTLCRQENANLPIYEGLHVDGTLAAEAQIENGGTYTPELEDCTSSAKISTPSCQDDFSNAQPQEADPTANGGSGSDQMHVREVSSPTIRSAVWQPASNMTSKSLYNSNYTMATLPNVGNSSTTSFSLSPPNLVPFNGAPEGFWPGFTWPFLNPVMWGVPGPWTMPIYPPRVEVAAAAAALLPLSTVGSGPQTQPLLERSQPEKCLWVPKTIRIDDPLNAARSSIWSTLGLGDGPMSSPAHGSTNVFQAKADPKEAISANRLSNPAALSRSIAFQENI